MAPPAGKSKTPFFAEITYEDGSMSTGYYLTEDEMLRGLSEHHRRAKNGEAGGPAGRDDTNQTTFPATRVARVRLYDKHPSEYEESQLVTQAEAEKRFAQALKDAAAAAPEGIDAVFMPELLANMRATTDALVREADLQHPHDSKYKMPERATVDPGRWGGGD